MKNVYERKSLLRFTAYGVVTSWLLLVCFISIFMYGVIHGLDIDKIFISTVILFVFVVVISVLTSLFHKCPNCHRCFLVEVPGMKHQNARSLWKLDYWATAIIDILFKKSFVCMYCGTKYNL